MPLRGPVKFARGALYASPCGFASGQATERPAAQAIEPAYKFSRCSTLDCKAALNHDAPPMIFTSFFALLPALLGISAAQAPGELPAVRRVIVQDEIIIRVPVRIRQISPQLDWIEHKGPRCIRSGDLRGAMLSGPDSVDFLLHGKQRMRASFDTRCPALDFYGGFYLNTEDGKVCAGRDTIRSRLGSACVIGKFHRLEPKRHR